MSAREMVLARDLHACVRCGHYVGLFGDFSIHHRRPRGMGGSRRPETNLPGNLLTLCGSGTTGCHGYIESHRAEAQTDGLIVSQHVDYPAEIPVKTHRGWMRLDDEGGYEFLERAS